MLSSLRMRMVALCAEEPQRYSDLKRKLAISDTGLAKALHQLTLSGFIAHERYRYVATQEGRDLVKEMTLTEEIRKQKLVQRLLVLQQLVRPNEILAFESLRALLKQKDLTLTRYEALAVAEALEVTTDRELKPNEALKIYANAISTAGIITTPAKASCRFVVTMNLSRGFSLVEKRLMRELEDEYNPRKRKKLEEILEQVRTQRPALIRDAHKRFLKLEFM